MKEPIILFEDNHLLVVVKPAGWLSQSESEGDLSVETWGRAYRKHREGKPGRAFLSAAHRLDRPVGGILCLAKTSKALSRLHESQRQGFWKKEYYAVVKGPVHPSEATLEHWLVHDPYQARVVEASHPQGKQALLEYRTEKLLKEGVLLRIRLHTGRYHQIRCQLAEIGHPIHGDERYSSSFRWPEQGIALWSTSLRFPHPIHGEEVGWEIPLPRLLKEKI